MSLVRVLVCAPVFRSTLLPRRLLFFLLFPALLACSHKAQEGHGLLPPPRAGQTTSAVPSPAPFNQTLGPAAFGRTVFHATAANFDLTVQDVIIGPRSDAQLSSSSGPMVIDTRSGSGSASAGGKTADLSLQKPASFPAGAAITFKNSGDVPLVMRMYVLEGK